MIALFLPDARWSFLIVYIFTAIVVVVYAVASSFKMLNNVLIKLLRRKYCDEYKPKFGYAKYYKRWIWFFWLVQSMMLRSQLCDLLFLCCLRMLWISAVPLLQFSNAENLCIQIRWMYMIFWQILIAFTQMNSAAVAKMPSILIIAMWIKHQIIVPFSYKHSVKLK